MISRGVRQVDVLEAHRRLTDGSADGSAAGSAAGSAGGSGDRAACAPAPLLVDVREVREFMAVRAAGAALLPMSTILPRLDELPRDRELLFICRSGNRSYQVAAFLVANGWTNVANVAGGMVAWERSGLPVRRGPEGVEGARAV